MKGKELMEANRLAEWCYEQDRLYAEGKLSKEKIRLLKKIDFPFGTYHNKLIGELNVMKCPIESCEAKLVVLSEKSKDYERGMTHKCMKCKKFFTIVGEDF